jgi:hypothetical protein
MDKNTVKKKENGGKKRRDLYQSMVMLESFLILLGLCLGYYIGKLRRFI